MLGKKIYELRTAAKMTQKKLGELTGVTASYISMIERNLVAPSLSTLRRISQTLGLSMSALLENDNNSDDMIYVFDSSRQNSLTSNGEVIYEYRSPLHAQARNNSIEILRSEMSPDAYDFDNFISHNQDECTYVLYGTLEVLTQNETYRLSAGDSIYLKKNVLHRFHNVGAGVLILLSCLGPTDEKSSDLQR